MSTRSLVHLLGTAALLAVLATPVSATAVINIINLDGPGEGLNDPTPAVPVGGNPGTTIGEQRLLCLQRAAEIWGAALTSTVPINVQVQFNPRTGGALQDGSVKRVHAGDKVALGQPPADPLEEWLVVVRK